MPRTGIKQLKIIPFNGSEIPGYQNHNGQQHRYRPAVGVKHPNSQYHQHHTRIFEVKNPAPLIKNGSAIDEADQDKQ